MASGGADIIGVDIGADIPGLHYHLASQHDLQETIELIERTGQRAIIRQADVRDLDSLTTVVNDGVAELGRLDIVVANAGIFSLGTLLGLDEATWQAMIDVHLTAPFRIIRAATPYMREVAKQEMAEGKHVQRKIINISSVSGVVGNPGETQMRRASRRRVKPGPVPGVRAGVAVRRCYARR